MDDPPAAVPAFLGQVQLRPCFVVNSTPQSCSQRTLSGAWRVTNSTVSSWHSPPPAVCVSAACSSGLSSAPIAAAMPPWAQLLELSVGGFFASRPTAMPGFGQTQREGRAAEAGADDQYVKV